MRIKEILINWLFSGITVNSIKTEKLIVRGPSTAYIDLLDMDHKSSDPGSPTESQMWYNSTTHVMKYRTNTETVEF